MDLDDLEQLANPPLSDGEVVEALAPHADPAALASFQLLQMRYEVTNGQLDPGRVLYAPVQCPGGMFMAASFTLEPDEAEEGSWVTVWHAVHGPMTLDALKELASA